MTLTEQMTQLGGSQDSFAPLATLTTGQKNDGLLAMADAWNKPSPILSANERTWKRHMPVVCLPP